MFDHVVSDLYTAELRQTAERYRQLAEQQIYPHLGKIPRVPFHGLRHTHVSALIDGGLDVFSVSRRIGHGSPALTLKVYSHMFTEKDAQAIEAVLRTGIER